jgi:glycine/serine hydroxymethyltransferase
VIAAELAARVFQARHAEVRVGSGAFANLTDVTAWRSQFRQVHFTLDSL